MRLPLLATCDTLVLGSGLGAMICALSQPAGRQVLMASMDTFLYADLFNAGEVEVPEGGDAPWRELLFPPEILEEEGRLHPARTKIHGERLLAARGIRVLYACQVMAFGDGLALLGHKSGLYAVRCREVLDLSKEELPSNPVYCLHSLHEGRHLVRRVPVSFPGSSAREQRARFEQALASLPAGERLGRGGTAAAPLQGFSLGKARQAAAAVKPLPACWPLGEEAPRCGNPLARDLPQEEVPIPQAIAEGRYGLVVVGGGTAGAAAAIYAARQGLKVLLLEMNRALGGTGTLGGVSSYWFGERRGANLEIDGAVDRLYQRIGQNRQEGLWSSQDVFLPDLKAQALLGLCLEAGVEVRFSSLCCGVKMEGARVTGVYWAQEGSLRYAESGLALDCTGDGDVCVFAGAAHHYGQEGDGMTYWASLAQFTGPDSYRNNFSTMVHVGDPWDYSRFIQASRLLGEAPYDHGSYVAPRESRHIRGMDTLTLEDILLMKQPARPLITCYSNYDPKGRLLSKPIFFGFLPPNLKAALPLGAFVPVDQQGKPLEGLLVGGKAISAAHDAFPGIRMQPDIQRQGMALGLLAACAVRQGVPAWQAEGVLELMAREGESLHMDVPAPLSLAEAVEGITGQEPWEWLDASLTSRETAVSPVIRLMLAPREEALPPLVQAYEEGGDPARLLSLARLLLYHRDERGAGRVMMAIRRDLEAGPGLPRRQGSVNFGQLLPDHGLMPETVYLLNSLAGTSQTPVASLLSEVAGRLENQPRDWRDLRAGVYCYCESIAYIARGRRDPGLLPLLKRVLAFKELRGEENDPLLFQRFLMLRLTLLSAMRDLGSEEGTQGLRALLGRPERAIAEAARMLLDS